MLRSFRQVLLRPGAITADWARGVRVRYLSPFQLFLLVNVVVALLSSALGVPSWSTTSEAWDVDQWQVLLRAQADELGMGPERHRLLFEATAAGIAKATVIVVIPLGALLSWLLHFRRRRPLGVHLVLATHLVAFLLLVPDFVVSGLFGPSLFELGRDEQGVQGLGYGFLRLLAPTVPLMLWLTLAVRRVFGVRPIGAVVRGFVGGALLFFVGAVFHQWVVLHLTLWQLAPD